MSLRQFDLQLASFLNKVKETHASNVRTLGSIAMTSIVEFTPIDTSRARANYVASLNAPFMGEVPFVEGKDGSTADTAFTSTQRSINLIRNQYRFGDKIYIRNNVPYIEDLENGKSPQSEAMLQFTIQELELEMDR